MREVRSSTWRDWVVAVQAFAILAGGGSAASAGEDRDALMIVLRASARVQGGFVRILDLADLPGGPMYLRDHVGGILLGFTPDPGCLREISSDDVASRIRESGIEAERFALKGAPRCAVFLEELAPQAASPREAADRNRTPVGATGSSRPSTPARRPTGDDAGSSIWQMAMQKLGTPEAGKPAQPPLRRGPAVKSKDPAAGRSKPSSSTAPSAKILDGTPASSPTGQAPSTGVEKGTPVSIRRSGRSLNLEDPGLALGSASLGGTVEVKNLRTGKKVLARVDGPGTVVPWEATAVGEDESR